MVRETGDDRLLLLARSGVSVNPQAQDPDSDDSLYTPPLR
jgi:hypothetical protein